MRFEGVLIAWQQEAGHGLIRPLGGGGDVFVRLPAFPTDGEGPRLDEPLSFEIATGRDGRKQAVNLQRLPRANPALREATGAGRAKLQAAQRKRRLALVAGAVAAVAIAGVLVAGGVSWWHGSPRAGVPVPTGR